MREQRRDDDRANQLLDAARVVLEAAGGWEIPAKATTMMTPPVYFGSPNSTSARPCGSRFGLTSIK